MAPKAKPSKKDKEREEKERLEREQEELRREEEAQKRREVEAALAAELERREQEKLRRLPPKFHFRVYQVGWKMGNPPARYGHVSLNLNGLLFVFSGSIGTNRLGYFFDLAAKQWTEQPMTGDAPASNLRMSVVQYGIYVYFYGGYGEKGLSTDLFRLDTLTFAWERLTYTGHPPQYYGMSAVLHGDQMVVFGGRSVDQLLSNATFALNLKTLHWDEIPTFGQMPSRRFAHSAVAVGSQMYVYGGLDALGVTQPTEKREDGNSFYCLDLDSGEWSLKTFKGRGPGPSNAIHGETLSHFKNGLVVTLGCQNDNVYVLALEEGRWQRCNLTGDDLGGRMYHTATVFLEKGIIALFGGQNRKTGDEFNDTFLLKMVTDEEEA